MTAVAAALRIVGVGCVSYGLWLVHPSAAFIFAGLVATATGRWLYNRKHRRPA